MAVDKIVAVASGLQWSIPLLSYSIVQGAVTGFVHLASSLVAAGELTTGSRNLDNISIGNMQRAQQIAHKTDLNSSFATGASSYQHADGMVQTTRADGESFYTSNNFSSGSVKANGEQAWMNQHSNAFDEHKSLVESGKVSYDKAKTAALDKTANYVKQIAEEEMKSGEYNYESLGEDGKTLQKVVNHVKELHKTNINGYNQLNGATLEAYFEAGGKTPDTSPIQVKGGVVAKGNVTANNTSEQSLSDSERTNRSHDASENVNSLIRAASNEQWAQKNNINTSYAEDTKASYNEMQSYNEQISLNRDKMQTHSDAISRIENNSGNITKDFYDDLADQVLIDYNLSSKKDAVTMIESHDSRINKSFNKVVDKNFENLTSEIEQRRQRVSDGEFNQKKKDFENEHAPKVNDKGLNQVKKHAEEKGLSEEALRGEMNETQKRLGAKHKKMIEKNNKKYSDGLKKNEAKDKELQEESDKYEKDRIGQGRVGKTLGVGGPTSAKNLMNEVLNNQKNNK